MKKLLMLSSYILFINQIYAQEQVVTTQSCAKLNVPSQPFMLVLRRGQDVLTSVTACLQTAKVPAVTFSAIGALQNPTIAYFNFTKNHYIDKKLSGFTN